MARQKKMTWAEELGCPLIIPIQHINGGQLLLVNTDYYRLNIRRKPNRIDNITPSFVESCIVKDIQEG